MQMEDTIKRVTQRIERISTDFEKTNTEIKRKYLLWNINAFNIVASKITGYKGSFGTGYPFYALNEKLEGRLPIIEEQIRYNRQLIKDGIPFQNSIWKCKSCLNKKYNTMPNLKKVCKPCSKMVDELKPRKIINRLPDIDMWVICEDGKIEKAQEEMTNLLKLFGIYPSDINPIQTIENVENITDMLKNGETPSLFLPVDAHIIEYSTIKELIEQVPNEINRAKRNETIPYLPILPKSYRKKWQYDDEAYNYVYDYLAAFTPFNFPTELEQSVNKSRKRVVLENTPDELFKILLECGTKVSFRRFQTPELKKCFFKKIFSWKELNVLNNDIIDTENYEKQSIKERER